MKSGRAVVYASGVAGDSRGVVEAAIDTSKGNRKTTWESVAKQGVGKIRQWENEVPREVKKAAKK